MPTYAGEKYLIEQTAEDFDRVGLTDDDVDHVSVTVYDSAGDEAVAEVAMDWNSTASRWEYSWLTAGYDPGDYRIRCILYGPLGDDDVSIEYKKVRLSPTPV